MFRSSAFLLIVSAVMFMCPQMNSPVTADVIEMSDGRRFEGEITNETPSSVTIDAMVAGIRAKLTLPQAQIAAITKSPVAADFYEAKIPVAARAADSPRLSGDETGYLEVPIVGRIGQTIFADAIGRILAYAQRYRIEHVVFTIDAQEGNIDEATRIFDLLMRFDDSIKYHAVIRRSIGDPMIFSLLADTIQVLPGGTVGGSDLSIASRTAQHQPAEEAVLRQQMAIDASHYMQQHGRPGVLIMSMIDPELPAAAWKDADGKLQMNRSVPEGIAADQVIVQHQPGSVLVLTQDQCLKLGMPAFDGSAADLGPRVLHIDKWKLESDFGAQTMKSVAAMHQQQVQNKARAAERQIADNIQRRQQTQRNFQFNLAQARQWDPAKGNYATMGGGWNYDGYQSTAYLTPDARADYRNRTDLTLISLKKALDAARAMKGLDEQATALGLEPTYGPDVMNQAVESIKMHMAMLAAERDRRTQ